MIDERDNLLKFYIQVLSEKDDIEKYYDNMIATLIELRSEAENRMLSIENYTKQIDRLLKEFKIARVKEKYPTKTTSSFFQYLEIENEVRNKKFWKEFAYNMIKESNGYLRSSDIIDKIKINGRDRRNNMSILSIVLSELVALGQLTKVKIEGEKGYRYGIAGMPISNISIEENNNKGAL